LQEKNHDFLKKISKHHEIVYNAGMNKPSIEELNQWSKSRPGMRRLIAQKCGVCIGTVQNWFAKNHKIPEKGMIIMLDLYEKSKTEDIAAQNIVLVVGINRFDSYDSAAKAKGCKLKDWMMAELDQAACISGTIQYSKDQQTYPTARVAETPPTESAEKNQKKTETS
jgi:hypothetical protein